MQSGEVVWGTVTAPVLQTFIAFVCRLRRGLGSSMVVERHLF